MEEDVANVAFTGCFLVNLCVFRLEGMIQTLA